MIFHSLAAKIGAFAMAPLLMVGAHMGISSQTNTHLGTPTVYAQTDASTTPSASWKNQNLVCTTLDKNLSLGSWDGWRGTGEVTQLQNFLRAEGYLKSQPSGFYGSATAKAVRSFQSAEGLAVSGSVNADTRAKIESLSCGDTTGGGSTSATLSITDISAPTTLAVDEEGIWTVNASTTATSSLNYSVKWGDEGIMTMARALVSNPSTQTSATFTHTYSSAGTYTPEFTVTDANGDTVSKAAASVVVGVPQAAKPHISSLSAVTGYAGDSVTITGTGFTASSTVYVGGSVATSSTITDDTDISFTVPSMGVGSYDVYVTNENGASNAIRFELKAKPAARVSVSGVDAPIRLSVNEEGTWTVRADTNASNLHYSAVWGDESTMRMMALSAASTIQASSTFTHTYTKAGNYTPKFTVTDDAGHSASVSASVVVTK